MVANEEGNIEPFFGSDRFAYLLNHLKVPYSDIEIKPAKASSRL
jgi:hypothetical protein